MHPVCDGAHDRLAVPEEQRRECGRDDVAHDHDGPGCCGLRDRAEGGEVQMVLVSGDGMDPGRRAEHLEDDVERGLADQHGERDASTRGADADQGCSDRHQQ